MSTYSIIFFFAVNIYVIVFLFFRIKNNLKSSGYLSQVINIGALLISLSLFSYLIYYIFNYLHEDIRSRTRFSEAKISDVTRIEVKPFPYNTLIDSTLTIADKSDAEQLFLHIKNAHKVYEGNKQDRDWITYLIVTYKNKKKNIFRIDQIKNGPTIIFLMREDTDIEVFKNNKLGKFLEKITELARGKRDSVSTNLNYLY